MALSIPSFLLILREPYEILYLAILFMVSIGAVAHGAFPRIPSDPPDSRDHGTNL